MTLLATSPIRIAANQSLHNFICKIFVHCLSGARFWLKGASEFARILPVVTRTAISYSSATLGSETHS